MYELRQINITYDRQLLVNTSLFLERGKLYVLAGESGIGKTSLLYRVALIDIDCDITYEGNNINQMNNEELSNFKRNYIGFVLQENDLIDHLTVEENINLFAALTDKSISEKELTSYLKEFRLEIPFSQTVSTLSLGQKQRLALACSLIKEPDVLVLDEPTASLDKENEKIIINILKEQIKKRNIYLLISSHSKAVVKQADICLKIKNKKIISETNDSSVKSRINKTSLYYEPIDKNFEKHYIKYELKRSKRNNTIYALIALILMIINFLVIGFIDYQNGVQEELLVNSFVKEILIMNEKDEAPLYTNRNFFSEPKSNFQLKPLNQIYIEMGNPISIIPYFSKDDISSLIETEYYDNELDGVYLSNRVYKLLREKNANVQYQFDATTTIVNSNGNEVVQDYDYKINGVLKQGVTNHFDNNNAYFMYMHYDVIDSFFSEALTSTESIGYIFQGNKLENLEKAKESFEDKGFYVNSDAIKMDEIKVMQRSHDRLKILFTVGFIIAGVVILSILNWNTLKKKRREIAILKINGLSNNYLTSVYLKSHLYVVTKATIIYLLIAAVLTLGFHISIYAIFLPLLLILMEVLVAVVVFTNLIKKVKTSKVLRNN
ncbi:hypothetical protein A4S06_10945 [Erysipelotrichaceae bacterium MTC7]|nr:hypothetical protein A4S06_10945 [Erysipelotrichaceae bacterium MTC7]